MPASIGGAGTGTEGALHFSGGSGAVSTVIRVAVVLRGLLRIGRLILRTRLGRQGLLRRNLITVFFTVNNPREKFSHPRHPGHRLRRRHARPAMAVDALTTCAAATNANAHVEQKPLEISTPRNHAQCRRARARASPMVAGTAANASTTGPQRGAKSFHIRLRRSGAETWICAKLRTPVGTVRLSADAAPRARSEPAGMSPMRSSKQKRPPEGGRSRTRRRRLSGRRSPGLRRTRPDRAGR